MRKKFTQDDIIRKIHDKFGNKFDCSKVVYKGIDEKITLICPEHGEFERSTYTLLKSKYGCPKCGYINATKQITDTKEIFIEKAKEVHGEKYIYNNVKYMNANAKVCIICREHGEFWQRVADHLKGKGCPTCGYINIGNKKRFSTDAVLEHFKKIHGDKYIYNKVEFKNVDTKVCIICPEHGEFWQTPSKHLKGQGCPECGKLKQGINKRNTNINFIKKSQKIHCNKYIYTKTQYIKSDIPICIICPKHGEFIQRPDKHLIGHGCPKCSKHVSNCENEIYCYLKMFVKNIQQSNKNILNGKELDIYLPDYKLAIEYNGLLWHSEQFDKCKEYHLNKLNLCNKQDINLIQIFEDEYLEHKDIVLSKIKHILGKDTDLPKIQARKCVVREITKEDSRDFLNKNHIQGFASGTIYLGCFQDNHLVGVMTFKEERKGNNRWELNRFATDINYRCIGIGGKLFNYFLKNYNPDYIKSFADRRWTLDKDNNLYTRLEFTLGEVLKPDYRYFFNKRYGATRVHKFNFRKQTLIKKYPNEGLTEDMTEFEMTQKLGAYRIWDCGLFKFEWWKK